MQSTRGRSALMKLLAVVVLAVAAWLLLKLVLNVVVAVAWAIAGILLVVAVLWAISTLRP
jgi:lipopolysaccharide export LptBFGC system permease protein LptF